MGVWQGDLSKVFKQRQRKGLVDMALIQRLIDNPDFPEQESGPTFPLEKWERLNNEGRELIKKLLDALICKQGASLDD